jgi:hypothetical protein
MYYGDQSCCERWIVSSVKSCFNYAEIPCGSSIFWWCRLRGLDGGPWDYIEVFTPGFLVLGDFHAWRGLSHFYWRKKLPPESWEISFMFFAERKAMKLVAGGGIEPPTRGFSILMAYHGETCKAANTAGRRQVVE